MARRKVEGTPAFVMGLLMAADRILPPERNSSRLTDETEDTVDASPAALEKLGLYQGRVVLAALAAELALKFLFEQRDEQKVASPTHDLHELFGQLTEHDQRAVGSVYQRLLGNYVPSQPWCNTAGEVFMQCKDVFTDWRYIVEEGRLSESFQMRVLYLSMATRSVLEVANLLPLLPIEPPRSLSDLTQILDKDHPYPPRDSDAT